MKKLLITFATPFLLWSCGEAPNPMVNSSTATSFEPVVKVSSKQYSCVDSKCVTKSYIIFYDNDTRTTVSKDVYDKTNIGDAK